MYRAVRAVQRGPVPQWWVYEQQLLHHDRDLLHLLGVHQQVGISQWDLCCWLRCLLCELHLHLWSHGLHQHHLHQEPGIPQQRHAHQYGDLHHHHQEGLRQHLSAQESFKNVQIWLLIFVLLVLRLDFETFTGYTYTAADGAAGTCTDKGSSRMLLYLFYDCSLCCRGKFLWLE